MNVFYVNNKNMITQFFKNLPGGRQTCLSSRQGLGRFLFRRGFRRRIAGQTLIELGVLGSVLILVLGLLIQYGLSVNFGQDMQMWSFRRALQQARTKRAASRQAQTVAVEDKKFVDADDVFGFMRSSGMTETAQATWSPHLDGGWTGDRGSRLEYPCEDAELPCIDYEINGETFSFTTADFKNLTVDNSSDWGVWVKISSDSSDKDGNGITSWRWDRIPELKIDDTLVCKSEQDGDDDCDWFEWYFKWDLNDDGTIEDDEITNLAHVDGRGDCDYQSADFLDCRNRAHDCRAHPEDCKEEQVYGMDVDSHQVYVGPGLDGEEGTEDDEYETVFDAAHLRMIDYQDGELDLDKVAKGEQGLVDDQIPVGGGRYIYGYENRFFPAYPDFGDSKLERVEDTTQVVHTTTLNSKEEVFRIIKFNKVRTSQRRMEMENWPAVRCPDVHSPECTGGGFTWVMIGDVQPDGSIVAEPPSHVPPGPVAGNMLIRLRSHLPNIRTFTWTAPLSGE